MENTNGIVLDTARKLNQLLDLLYSAQHAYLQLSRHVRNSALKSCFENIANRRELLAIEVERAMQDHNISIDKRAKSNSKHSFPERPYDVDNLYHFSSMDSTLIKKYEQLSQHSDHERNIATFAADHISTIKADQKELTHLSFSRV